MRRSKYPTELSDAEWACLKPYLPAPKKRGRGRPNVHSPPKILNAVFYLLKSGCPWRLLPRDFPPWKSVYHWFRKWRIDGTFERLNLALRERLGTQLGRETHSPVRVSSILSRPRRAEWAANSEGTTEEVRRFSRPQATPARGYGRLGPQSKGSQRQKLPDQDAINKLLLKLLLKAARQRLPRLSYLWVDAGYQGSGKEWVEQELGLSVEVVHRTPKPTSEKIARIWAQEWAK
jgi:putative transposase